MTIEFWWRQISIIHKPRSLDVPQKIWARSVQPFWRLLDTSKQTDTLTERHAKFIYRFGFLIHFTKFKPREKSIYAKIGLVWFSLDNFSFAFVEKRKLSNYRSLKRFICLKWILKNFCAILQSQFIHHTLPETPFKCPQICRYNCLKYKKVLQSQYNHHTSPVTPFKCPQIFWYNCLKYKKVLQIAISV